jgi:hypothetical protein
VKGASINDGNYTLATRLVNELGESGVASQSLSVTVDTSATDTIRAFASNDLIRGGGGNDTIDLTQGGVDTLLYTLLPGATADGTGGNGFDTVTGFSTGAGGDVINISALLNSHAYTTVSGTSNSAKDAAEAVKLDVSAGTATLFIDRDGTAGNAYSFVQLLQFTTAATDATTLLSEMFTNKNLVL